MKKQKIIFTDEYIMAQFNKLTMEERLSILFNVINKLSRNSPLEEIADEMGYERRYHLKKPVFIPKKEMAVIVSIEETNDE